MISKICISEIKDNRIQLVKKNSKQINTADCNHTKNNSADVLKYMPQYVSFKSLNSVSADLHKTPETINFKEYFNKGKYIHAKIWTKNGLILNPEAENYVKVLDNLDSRQKKEFVKEFCTQTGFPDLSKIKNNMDTEIINKVNNVCNNTGYKSLFTGYSNACSLDRGTALPGSDCDGLFIVVDKEPDYSVLNRCVIGNSINQRLINTTGSHYPELFSIQHLMNYIQIADKLFEKIKTPEKVERYKENLLNSEGDFIKAGEFNIDIASEAENPHTKNMLYLTSLFVEELRAGSVLINNLDKDTINRIKSSALYKYGNAARQEGFSKTTKAKWENRKRLCNQFQNMNNEGQFKLCKEIFKSSLGITNKKQGGCFERSDLGNIEDFIRIVTTFDIQ